MCPFCHIFPVYRCKAVLDQKEIHLHRYQITSQRLQATSAIWEFLENTFFWFAYSQREKRGIGFTEFLTCVNVFSHISERIMPEIWIWGWHVKIVAAVPGFVGQRSCHIHPAYAIRALGLLPAQFPSSTSANPPTIDHSIQHPAHSFQHFLLPFSFWPSSTLAVTCLWPKSMTAQILFFIPLGLRLMWPKSRILSLDIFQHQKSVQNKSDISLSSCCGAQDYKCASPIPERR